MKRILIGLLALAAVVGIVWALVAYGHTAVRPTENPPAPNTYHVPHGTCTDITRNGVDLRECQVVVHGSLWETGPIGRHTDPVKFIEKKVNFK